MSDFGALLIFSKQGSQFNKEDKAQILSEVNNAIKEGVFSSHIKERKYDKLYLWEDVNLCLKLTEYYDDEDSDEIREFAEEEDVDEANEIIDIISQNISGDIQVRVVFEDW